MESSTEQMISEPNNTLAEFSLNTEQENTTQESAQAIPQEEIQQLPEQSAPLSPIEAALSTRNMLRSRKKQGASAKKSNDATLRQSTTNANINNQNISADIKISPENQAESNEVALASPVLPHPEPEQEYTPEIVDPSQHKHANQVDKWAHMIDAMALGGRIRQLAIHSTIDDVSDDNKLVMHLDQINQHLLNDNAQNQLQQSVCQYLQRSVIVEINIVAETKADPFAIQSHINDKRYEYAKEVIENDDVVQALQSEFQATLNVESIQAK